LKRDLGALSGREHDLLIIGGGIYGAAAAWDAAQRGLAVALVEAEDFGSGTSWNSLKTIHGGLRHLQRAELRLMRESMRERRALLRIAPRLVRPLPFLVPTYGHGGRGREVLALGLIASDLLANDRNRGLPLEQSIPGSRMLSPAEVLELVPGLPQRGLTGGALWHDAQVASGERLVLAFVHAAASAGAVVANHAEVMRLARCSNRMSEAVLRDAENGASLRVRARLVLSCAGPWMDDVLGRAGVSRPRVPLLSAMNLVLRTPAVRTHAVGALSGGRYLFIVPWRGRSIVGTSYAPEGAAAPLERSIDAFRQEAARAYPWAAIEPDDVTLVHAGRVPGSGGAQGLWSQGLLVDHEAEDGVEGLLSVQGAKYTTARAMAQRAVDRVLQRLGRASPPCRTAVTLLPEARPLEGPLEERARRAVREEMASRLTDAVLRRLDLGTAGPPETSDLEVVVRTMSAELGWDDARTGAEREALERVYPSVAAGASG
jgi:glycerol-3-phosphate dehydrogenase